MKMITLLIALSMALASNAQIQKVSLQASGLTCSMCSNAINKALQSLDFVDRIENDLKTYTFDITFKNKAVVDFDKIKRKVEGAGFSISRFEAVVDFGNLIEQKTDHVLAGNNKIVLMNRMPQPLNGIRKIKLLDKGFVSAKEFKKSKLPVLEPGSYHASI